MGSCFFDELVLVVEIPQICDVLFINEQIWMKVAILNNLCVQVRELFAHEFDCTPCFNCTHILNARVEVTWESMLLIDILCSFLQEVVCERTNFWICDRQHETYVRSIVFQRHSGQFFDGQLLFLQNNISTFLLVNLEVDVLQRRRQFNSFNCFVIQYVYHRSRECGFDLSDPLIEKVLCTLNGSQFILLIEHRFLCVARYRRYIALNRGHKAFLLSSTSRLTLSRIR